VCEGHGHSYAECRAISCCMWDSNSCWSAVGQDYCTAGVQTGSVEDLSITTWPQSSGGVSGGNTGSPPTAGAKVVWPLKTSPVSQYAKYTTVFGVGVLAHSSVTATQFQHLASVLAEWLDNDQDGCVDSPLVVSKMLSASPKPVMLAPGKGEPNNAAQNAMERAGVEPVALVFNDELLPNCAGPKATDNCADASLEEVLHMVTSQGYAKAWPDIFSEGPQAQVAPRPSSVLTTAMDVARGGKFQRPPSKYPSSAWYTYDDRTCTYECMATEYIYWGVSAWVGALVGRRQSIKQEWRFETREKLIAGDALMTALIRDTSTYRLPSVSPTGSYYGTSTCSSGSNHS